MLTFLLTILPYTVPLNPEPYALPELKKMPPPAYTWNHQGPPPITKEYFRCKGCRTNPVYTYQDEPLSDCEGWHKHSLPVRDKEEFIYPILITLLNYIQERTSHKVIITSGHRCPQHNTYVDPTKTNQYSKHMIGGEVSFYVEGMETDPMAIVDIIQEYYKTDPFRRYEGETNVTTQPWMNKEIFIKLFKETEGRNRDNQHGHPYLSLQVRYDKERGEAVVYTWGQANRGYFLK